MCIMLCSCMRHVNQAIKTGGKPEAGALDPTPCWSFACDPERIRTVHTYLCQYFPDAALEDLHEPGGAGPSNHLVVLRAPSTFYSLVLTRGFLQHPPAELDRRLRQWNVAQALRTHRILIMWADSLSPA